MSIDLIAAAEQRVMELRSDFVVELYHDSASKAWAKSVVDKAISERDALVSLVSEFDRLKSLLSAQPIETAPRDGTHILVFEPHWGWSVAAYDSDSDEWLIRFSEYTAHPTHWTATPLDPETT